MSKTTVSEFATQINIPVERLQSQFLAAGLGRKKPGDLVTEEEKKRLSSLLDQNNKNKPKMSKITLQRKETSELEIVVPSAGRVKPRSKIVNVEVRKRRTYAKRSDVNENLQQKEQQAKDEMQHQDIEDKEVKLSVEEIPVNQEEEQTTLEQQTAEVESEISSESEAVVDQVSTSDTPKDAPKKTAKKKQRFKKHQQRDHNQREELHITLKAAPRRNRKSKIRTVVQAKTNNQHKFEKPTAPVVKEISLPEHIKVSDLAQKMSVKGAEIVKVMMNLGSMVTINKTIDQDTAAIVVEEMGHIPKLINDNSLEQDILATTVDNNQNVVKRVPVVAVMGHVDHGKTSLLDYIRNARVADGEAGGITQHIGAYQVSIPEGEITFLDTPGHEAFAAMRARGAQVTDIVIIIVAADDGVMPQTQEAIKHAKAANVPIIVAINKIDKEGAKIDQIKQSLAKHDVISEEWGGDVIFVNVSAKTGEGIDSLLENILLTAEILDLSANDQGPAHGIIIESRLDRGQGAMATVLIKNGKLEKGNMIVAGCEFGRVRGLINDCGRSVDFAYPSTPVQVLGLSGTPNAGDEMAVVANEKKAREIALFRQDKSRQAKIEKQQVIQPENVFSQMQEGEVRLLHLLIKADVQGSAEALVHALEDINGEKVKVNIVGSGVGGINTSDINLAIASNAVVIGFNVRADTSARKLIDAEGIDLRYYSIIYNAINDIKDTVEGMREVDLSDQIVGIAEVRDVFKSPKFGDIAGCVVISGYIKRHYPIRVLRDNTVIYEGDLESLRRFKDDVNEVRSGMDCGIGIKNYNNIQISDQIEVFKRVQAQDK